MLASFSRYVLFGWLSAGFITAMMGFKVALFGDKHALTLPDERMPLDPTARTALIIGAVVIERVFVIPGLGSMLLDAVGNRDLLTVQSVVMVLVAITLIINLVVDVLYTILDPRIRKGA